MGGGDSNSDLVGLTGTSLMLFDIEENLETTNFSLFLFL